MTTTQMTEVPHQPGRIGCCHAGCFTFWRGKRRKDRDQQHEGLREIANFPQQHPEMTHKQPVGQPGAGAASATLSVEVTAVPPAEERAACVSVSARPEEPVDQQQASAVASGTSAQHSPRQHSLSDISEDANANPMQESMRALQQALAAEDAARKEVKEALQLVREMRAAELAKEEQKRVQEEAEEAARKSKRAGMEKRAQPVLYGTTKVTAAWEPDFPSMEETEDLLQQLEELAQQRWTMEVQPPKVQEVVREAPAQPLLQQTDQVPGTPRDVSEELLQQLQDLDIKCSETAPATHNQIAGAQQRRGEGSMASTRTPYSEVARDARTSAAGAANKAVSVTDGQVHPKTRSRAAPRKADGKGNGRILRRKNCGDDQRAATKQNGASAASAPSASPSSTTKKKTRRIGKRNTPSWDASPLQARQASVILETVQISPKPCACPVFSCQACPTNRRGAVTNI